jgi:hypothetical protein
VRKPAGDVEAHHARPVSVHPEPVRHDHGGEDQDDHNDRHRAQPPKKPRAPQFIA